jgi:long-chain fatty acid transport protein
LTLGTGFDVSKAIHVDVGYAHLFVKNSSLDHPNSSGYTLRGEYESSVDIFSAQLNWSF